MQVSKNTNYGETLAPEEHARIVAATLRLCEMTHPNAPHSVLPLNYFVREA